MPNNSIKDVAKNIIAVSNDMGFKITNLKLNNLLQFSNYILNII